MNHPPRSAPNPRKSTARVAAAQILFNDFSNNRAKVTISTVDPNRDEDNNELTEAMIGVNRFFLKAGHAFKVIMDISCLTQEAGPGVKHKDFRSRIKLQIVF